MGNPLKLNRTGNTSVDIQEMSNTDMDYITHLVLRKVALESDTSTGALNVSGVGTTAGVFQDTARVEAIGQNNANGQLITTTTTLSQNLQSVAETTIHPLELIDKQPKPISSANLNSNIMSYISSNLANTSSPSISQYYLSSSNPSESFSGTWVHVASLIDTFGGSGGISSSSTSLWKKTNDTIPTVTRPLKLGANGTIQEMTNVEIETLADRYRNRIVDTGIGTYALSASPPATGTWLQVGDTFFDSRQTVASNTYVGVFTGNFTGNFTNIFSRNFTGNFTNIFSRNFTGSFTGQYNRPYTGSYIRQYTGSYSQSYSGTYSRGFTGQVYTRRASNIVVYYHAHYAQNTSSLTFIRYFNRVTNVSYTGNFTGNYIANYTGQYARSYSGTYSGPVNKTFSSQFTGNFTGNFTGQFTGNFTGNFTNVFSSNFSGNFTSDTIQSTRNTTVSTVNLWLRIL